LGFGFWVLGFGFWVLGFGFWVFGFGFWVLGFGYGLGIYTLTQTQKPKFFWVKRLARCYNMCNNDYKISYN
jgi:hypothetical protein